MKLNHGSDEPMVDQIRRQTRDVCRHAVGTVETECKVGVNVRELVGGGAIGWAARTPCTSLNVAGQEKVPCDKFLAWTEEDVQEYATMLDESHERMMKLMPFLRFVKREAPKDTNVEAKCPICGGVIHYSVASYNNHVWAKCETKDCVAVME